jgi:hypothetical protein
MDSHRGVTDQGKREFRKVIELLKVKAGCRDWLSFAAWLSQRTGMHVSKDMLYRTAKGDWEGSPSFAPIAALTEVAEFTFVDSSERITSEGITQILFGEIDAYGHSVKSEAQREG